MLSKAHIYIWCVRCMIKCNEINKMLKLDITYILYVIYLMLFIAHKIIGICVLIVKAVSLNL